MKSFFRCFTYVCLLPLAVSAAADDKINVMTLNQYLGADLAPIISTADPDAFNQGLVSVLTQTAKSDFRARARAQADAIVERSPDVLALQEVWALRCKDFDPEDKAGCEDPEIAAAFTDHLELTLTALKKKGAKYRKAALIKNLDLEKINVSEFSAGIPFTINDIPAFLVAVDRDAILVRDRIKAYPVVFPDSLCPFPSVDGCNYQTAAEATTPLGPLRIERGFMAIDAKIAGNDYRIFNTHLEVKGEDLQPPVPLFTYYQAAQAYELTQVIGFSATTDRKTLLLGDMNSSPVQENPDLSIITPYKQFIAAQYFDIWDLQKRDSPGYTCCQDENLQNRKPSLEERIDMIFAVDDPEKAKKIRVIGDKASTKTKAQDLRLWFSDHAAVAAKLRF